MLKKIQIINFKSHKDTTLDLSNLNVLTGINGTGKSSTIQILLALRQSHIQRKLEDGLSLNKPLCEIGLGEEALYQYADNEGISINIEADVLGEPSWVFSADNDNLKSDFLPISVSVGANSNLNATGLFNNNFQYLSAERWSARDAYPKGTQEVETNKQLSLERGQGELTAHFLDFFGTKIEVEDSLLHPNELSNNQLIAQTNAWLKEISYGVNAIISPSGTGYEIRYQFEVGGGNLPTKPFRSRNVGFGIPYTLPIITAILSAKRGSLIIIENPEAHIHPYGQAKLMYLITLAAQNGVQFIIETHSDHIINSLAVACKSFEMGEKGINREKAKIYYFDKNESTHATEVHEIPILENGRLGAKPKGFFDQMAIDLRFLMKTNSRRNG
ncbi:MAG: AAA family ATPase [Chitinophagales bacterium]